VELGTAGRGPIAWIFEYSTDATSLTVRHVHGVTALSFSGPITTGAVRSAQTETLAANRTAITSTITGLSVPNGATFYIQLARFRCLQFRRRLA